MIVRLLMAIACMMLAASPALAERRIALVIGNADYPPVVGELRNTHQDAHAMADALQALGFELVTGDVVLDADHSAMLSSLFAFQQEMQGAGEDAIGFVYYSGHGGSHEDGAVRANYLIPSGVPLTSAEQLPLMGVSLNTVLSSLSNLKAKGVFIVVDACRNTLPLTSNRGGAQPDRGFSRVAEKAGTYIAFATADGETAPDDGVFAATLSEKLLLSNVTADRAFTLAFREVARKRAGYRRPTAQDGLLQDVCLNGPCGQGGQIPEAVLERTYFEASKTCDDYDLFLRRFPDGAHAEAAEAAREEMCAGEAPDAQSLAVRSVSLTRFLGQLDPSAPYFIFADAVLEIDAAFGRDALDVAVAAEDPIALAVMADALAIDMRARVADFYRSGKRRSTAPESWRQIDEMQFQRIAYFTRSCELGYVESCTEAAGQILKTEDVDASPVAGMLEKGCSAGDLLACDMLGVALSDMPPAAYLAGQLEAAFDRDTGRAWDLLLTNCDTGFANSCNNLGLFFQNGMGGTEPDFDKAIEYYARACDSDWAISCGNLYTIYSHGLMGQVPDADLADTYLARQKAIEAELSEYELESAYGTR